MQNKGRAERVPIARLPKRVYRGTKLRSTKRTTFYSMHLNLVHVPPSEMYGGKRRGEVTADNVVLEDVNTAMMDFQLTEEIIETRNGRPELNPLIFEAAREKYKEFMRMAHLLQARIELIDRMWPRRNGDQPPVKEEIQQP